ncbi:MAG: hypothetical protein JWO08_2653 [Verrucomicrobiaceae bacterium]|nr:hypothetical protein [Verrucomicrobiaceae bacterium]
MPTPSRAAERIATQIKRFQPILLAAKDRDVGEADTSTIVKDILSELFGYDKYSEITAEYLIKGTFCDLAIKLEGKLRVLVEVKAIGLELKEAHSKQAVDYGANQGVEWVLLTNGIVWRVYRIVFAQPISQELVIEVNFSALNPRTESHIDSLYLLTKEGHGKSLLDGYHQQRQAMSRFFLGALVLSDAVVEVIRRELRKLSPGVKFELDEIREVITHEVLKREVIEGDKAMDARKKIARAWAKAAKPVVKIEAVTTSPLQPVATDASN